MSNLALEQVVELALKLSTGEQAKLLERVAAHLAQAMETDQDQVLLESLADRTFEVWSPQDEGGAVAALNQVLQENEKQS